MAIQDPDGLVDLVAAVFGHPLATGHPSANQRHPYPIVIGAGGDAGDKPNSSRR